MAATKKATTKGNVAARAEPPPKTAGKAKGGTAATGATMAPATKGKATAKRSGGK